MSLTAHVADVNSPIRAFFADLFPNTRALAFADEPGSVPEAFEVAGIQTTIQSQRMLTRGDPQILPLNESGYPWRLAGTALDYRLRMELEVVDLHSTAAARGWTELVRRPSGERAPDSAWSEVVAAVGRLAALTAGHGGRTGVQELELARLCGLLGMYEQLYRMGGIFNQEMWDTSIARVGLGAPLTVLEALVDDRIPVDVAAMVDLFRSVPELTAHSRVVSNPVFARARELRGADGDVILDDLLLEVKAVKASRLSRAYVWQLLGYVLADTDDVYGIRRVGWYFARHGTVWSFGVEEFLRRLAGHDVDLAVARAHFADVCKTLSRPAQPPQGDDSPELNPEIEMMAWPAVSVPVQRVVSFSPPIQGSGRWHAPMSQVPRLAGADPATPACGARSNLDLTAPTIEPPVGADRGECDVRLCRRCLLYTEHFFGAAYDPSVWPELADLAYYPPAAGTGKWHVRAASTGFWFDEDAPDGPSCHAPVQLDLAAHPLRIPASGRLQDADPRLCRRCLGTPRHLPWHGGPGAGAGAPANAAGPV